METGLLSSIALCCSAAALSAFHPTHPALAHFPFALGYLDMGTGSMLIQALAAGIVGALVTLRRARTYLAAIFSPSLRKKLKEEREEANQAAQPSSQS